VEVIFAAWILLALVDVDYRPKRSFIFYSIFGFLVVIGLADLLGVAPVKSFWSNFERMEGFISLLHLWAFFLVIGSVFREIDWKRWWNISLAASALMVTYSVLQIIGVITINQGGVRVDGTLGNAIYLAVYMLFHIFIAILFMWREWKNIGLRYVYGSLILLQVFILYYTATRGAILGLIGGLFVVAVLNIRNKEAAIVRKGSIALLCFLLILIGGFFSIRNTAFVENSPVLSRFSSLTTEELKTQGRYFVWPMALEGVKERPLLGWGQENFNYVFNKHYVPEMYHLEPWFDRAHNIFLDWMVVGGILGLLAYLFLYVALLYSIWRKDINFSHTEKSIITGLIAAYFFHNFFVFDHLISYILFFSLLAYIYNRTGGGVLWMGSVSEDKVRRIALPAVAIFLVISLYFVNIKPIITNVFIIEAIKSIQTPGETGKALEHFQKAYNSSRLGQPEVVERVTASAVTIFQSDISMEEKNAFFDFAKDIIVAETRNSKDDARYELLAGSFLSTVGVLDEALVHLERAKELMPGKQTIYLEIANVYLNSGEKQKAIDVLRHVAEISPGHKEQMEEYIRKIESE